VGVDPHVVVAICVVQPVPSHAASEVAACARRAAANQWLLSVNVFISNGHGL
jgi:hypothetical protein